MTTIYSPPAIRSLPFEQQLTLWCLISADLALPPTQHSIICASAGDLSELAAIEYADALSAAEALWIAGYFQAFTVTNADNADHSFTGYRLETETRRLRSDLALWLDHELTKPRPAPDRLDELRPSRQSNDGAAA